MLKFNFKRKKKLSNGQKLFDGQKLSDGQLDKLFCDYAIPILKNENMKKTKKYIQHGNTSCYTHTICVAYYSLKLANKFLKNYNAESIIRGALLHDFFLYDWHEKSDTHKWHGFTHPKTALLNASKEFELNSIEKDIISKHMFPLTFSVPSYKESVIVCLVDKFCSTRETFYFGIEKARLLEMRLRLKMSY